MTCYYDHKTSAASLKLTLVVCLSLDAHMIARPASDVNIRSISDAAACVATVSRDKDAIRASLAIRVKVSLIVPYKASYSNMLCRAEDLCSTLV